MVILRPRKELGKLVGVLPEDDLVVKCISNVLLLFTTVISAVTKTKLSSVTIQSQVLVMLNMCQTCIFIGLVFFQIPYFIGLQLGLTPPFSLLCCVLLSWSYLPCNISVLVVASGMNYCELKVVWQVLPLAYLVHHGTGYLHSNSWQGVTTVSPLLSSPLITSSSPN